MAFIIIFIHLYPFRRSVNWIYANKRIYFKVRYKFVSFYPERTSEIIYDYTIRSFWRLFLPLKQPVQGNWINWRVLWRISHTNDLSFRPRIMILAGYYSLPSETEFPTWHQIALIPITQVILNFYKIYLKLLTNMYCM